MVTQPCPAGGADRQGRHQDAHRTPPTKIVDAGGAGGDGLGDLAGEAD
jgi:hypothetical protein